MAARQESPESVDAISHRLRLTRLAFGMDKVADWCRMTGISPQAWAGVEGTKFTPATNRIALDQALLICKATGVGLDWIYRGNRENVPMRIAVELQRLEAAEATGNLRRSPGGSKPPARR